MFLLPEKKYITELRELVVKRSTWEKDEKSYWYSDGEQSLLNHISVKYSDSVNWINESNYIVNLAVLDGRHPFPFDKGLAAVRYENGKFVKGTQGIALLVWTSLSLREHLKQGFRSLDTEVARTIRQDFYKLNSYFPFNIMEQMFVLKFKIENGLFFNKKENSLKSFDEEV